MGYSIDGRHGDHVVGQSLGWKPAGTLVVGRATAVHFYEAVLATLAIIVWHLYQVFFDPDVYPMNSAWLDGKMSVEHYREEHGLDTKTLSEAIEQAPEVASSNSAEDSTAQPDGEMPGKDDE